MNRIALRKIIVCITNDLFFAPIGFGNFQVSVISVNGQVVDTRKCWNENWGRGGLYSGCRKLEEQMGKRGRKDREGKDREGEAVNVMGKKGESLDECGRRCVVGVCR